ncbi:MAG: FAD-dependent oxidoreductase, partial [Acidobacteria bacterium]|nr:FAD-dependent oxidoreductase [Acidobacteriota bacterium]
AAALRLAETGYDGELIERRTVLGGRASSFVPPGEVEPIDNCQHVLLGCCTNLLDFFRRAGTAHQLRFYNAFWFLGPKGLSSVSASPLPAPLHLLTSLVSFRDLGWRDRWAIARAMWAILRTTNLEPAGTLLDWLHQQRQTPLALEHFWRVILTSALNEELEQLPCRPAFQVFREAFLSNRRGYRVAVPGVPLSELYSSRVLAERCCLRLGTAAIGLNGSAGRIGSVCLQNGEEKTADFYISGLPPGALARLLSEDLRSQWPEGSKGNDFEWSPITGIHLWFDRPVLRLHFVTLVGRTVQWIFNRSAIGGNQTETSGPQYLQLVVSASRSLLPLSREEIVELCLRELQELFPQCRQANLLKAVVVKESRATISLQPATEALRPGPKTPFSNLFLAGDWTASGWPPTMEGAVRSGYRAAELVTEAAGNPQKFLQPDLPAAPLVRLLQRW